MWLLFTRLGIRGDVKNMSKETVLVGRLRPTRYIVNFVGHDTNKMKYIFAGSKGNKIDKKQLPKYVVDDLLMSSNTFEDGELVIFDEKQEKAKDIEGIEDVKKYEDNTHSEEEIKDILNKTIAGMKKDLNKIDVLSEKQFVVKVAKDMKLDSKGKLKFLSEWMGVDEDILFDQ